MLKLDAKKAACDVAFATATQNQASADLATATKAGELKLTDPEYAQFRNDVTTFRNQFEPAAKADVQAAKQAADKIPTLAAQKPAAGS